MTNHIITVTGSQLAQIVDVLGYDPTATKTPQRGTQRRTSAIHDVPPTDSRAVAFGDVSDALQAYMESHATQNFRTTYRAPKVFKFVQKKTPLPKSYFAHETQWNDYAAIMWKQRCVTV